MPETTTVEQIVPITTQTEPVVTTASQTQDTPTSTQTISAVPAGDILDRVTKKREPQKTLEENAETFKEFDDITDPVLKQKMIDREKSRIADYTRKTQEISKQRKEFEEFQKQSQNWTPERIQRELLNNPQFIEAAKVVNTQNPAGSGLTDEQFSALTPAEKNQLLQVPELRTKINQLEQQNFITAIAQRDTLLASKYGDYDALKINQSFKDLGNMNVIDVREQIYKAVYHDDHVKNAYEMGLQDGKGLTQERQQGSTQTGFQTLASDKRPIRDKRDTDLTYFAKLAEARLAERRSQSKR